MRWTMAELWTNTVETWLLECTQVSDATNLQPSDSTSPNSDETFTEHQTEQLLAVCDLHNEKLLHAIFMLFEERSRFGE